MWVKSLENPQIFTKQTEATEPVWFQPEESRAVGLKAAKMLNREAREGVNCRVKFQVSLGIQQDETYITIPQHWNHNRIMQKVPQEHRKRILTLEKRIELIKEVIFKLWLGNE